MNVNVIEAGHYGDFSRYKTLDLRVLERKLPTEKLRDVIHAGFKKIYDEKIEETQSDERAREYIKKQVVQIADSLNLSTNRGVGKIMQDVLDSFKIRKQLATYRLHAASKYGENNEIEAQHAGFTA